MLTADLPGGWKQRVAFGAAVMHEPKILFLDEPTSGVDPLARRQFGVGLTLFSREGMAVLVTTHYLEEAEQCHRLASWWWGELVAQGTPRQVKMSNLGSWWNGSVTHSKRLLICSRNLTAGESLFCSRLHTILEQPSTQILKSKPGSWRLGCRSKPPSD